MRGATLDGELFEEKSTPKGGYYEIPNPLFFDTYKRSRRDTAGKRLVRSVRFFLVVRKLEICPTYLGQTLKNNSVSLALPLNQVCK